MTGQVVVATMRVADLEEFRLLVWELRQLNDDMRVSASPFADRLGHALERFMDRTAPADQDEEDGA